MSELDETLKNTSRSLEAFVASPMFSRLYDVMCTLNNYAPPASDQLQPQHGEDIINLGLDDDDESDDSYAARFGSCIRRLKIYLSAHAEYKALHGGLFRLIVVRNKVTTHTCVFAVKLRNIFDTSEQLIYINMNEFWFWWM